MAHLLGAEKVTLSFADKDIFRNLTIGIKDSDRIGVVGRNGDGKSSLLRLLTGSLLPDSGQVTKRADIRFGTLEQFDNFPSGSTVASFLVGDSKEFEWASSPRIREIFQGLLSDLDHQRLLSELSGGQRRRVALAALLAKDLDVLMLDEPTNHLDLEGVSWLASHLKNRWPTSSGALLLVTHDRWFLDEVCQTTWEVHDGGISSYDGGYASYILERTERIRSEQATESRRQNLLRKELAWLRRGAPARTSKPKFRIEAANQLIANEPAPRDGVNLARLATARLGKQVADLESVSFANGSSKVLSNITLHLGPGDRIGILGSNGIGKTTLAKILLGKLSPNSGRVKLGKTVVSAFLSQDVSELDPLTENRVADLLAREKSSFLVESKDVDTARLVEQLGFTSGQLQGLIRDLSGGQRRKLQLLRLLFGEPNLLVLDEPTNDLDTEMLAQVEDLLDSWPGTLIVISHDRYFLERTTDQQYALLPGGVFRNLPRGVDEYLELIKKQDLPAVETSSQTSVKSTGAMLREREKNLSKLERTISKLQQQEALIVNQMHEHDQADYEGLSRLASELAQLKEQREELEANWLAESSDS